MAEKKSITNRLKSLKDIEGVTVEISDGEKTINVSYSSHHSLDFRFRWLDDHFAGYFIDGEGKQSQAVISIWTGMQAIYFSTAYSLLVSLRSKQKKP